jgi:hypothetical protein
MDLWGRSALARRVLALGHQLIERDVNRRGQPIARLVPATPTAKQPSVEEIIVGLRALRLEVQASQTEIRSWIEEGRA